MNPPTPKKKNSGCLIAVFVVMGLCLLVVIAAGVGVYQFSQTEDGKAAFGIMAESVRMATDGREGPAIDALEAAGCDEAMVMDMSRLMKLLKDEAEQPVEDEAAVPWTVITCHTRSDTLDCDEVWSVFTRAVPERSGSYLVQVQAKKMMMPRKDRCQAAWSADGVPLELEEAGDALGHQFEE